MIKMQQSRRFPLTNKGTELAGYILFLLIACCAPRFANGQVSQTTAKPISPKVINTAQAIPQFIDVTRAANIHFVHLSSPDQKYIVESMGGGVALIDYDRDGWPDIYFTNTPSVEMALSGKKARGVLYHNNHDGTFTDVTEKAGVGFPCWGMGATVGDYNNDGWPDLLVTCFGGVVLYRNNGNGTFTDVTKEAGLSKDSAWATGATFGDYDNDGFVDLFVSHYVDFNLNDLPTFGSKKTCKYYTISVQCGPRGLKGSPDNLYHNNGDGTFTDVSKGSGVEDTQGFFGLTATWSHFDDGLLDLIVANDGEPNYLYRNDGKGHFTDISFQSGVAVSQDGNEQANMGVALGDYLNSGRFSIAITHFSKEYTALYRNDGELNFTDVSYAAGIAQPTVNFVGWGDAFLDIDNDGWQDFFMVNGHVYPQVDTADLDTKYHEPSLLFLNQHDGTFKDVSKLAGPAIQTPQVSRGLAVGDLFNDGHLDLVIENLQGQPMVLRSKGGPDNHWISFELQGTKSNRLALNARLQVTAGTLVQKGEIMSGSSYLSQNDLRLHFGLGKYASIDKAEVIWPSGVKESVPTLPADHFYCIKEGSGVVPCAAIRPTVPGEIQPQQKK